MTVLVTGATGNVGGKVIAALQARDPDVQIRALVRDPSRAGALPAGVATVVGDFGDPDSLASAVTGVSEVFLACGNHPRQAEYERNLIDAAADADVNRLVKLSAFGAEPGSPLDFWDAHGAVERHLAASGLPAVILRPTSYMTNLLANAQVIGQVGQLFAPVDAAKVSFIDPRDVADVAAVALTGDGHIGQTYSLSGPDSLTFADVAGQLSVVLGRPVEFVDVPEEAARAGMVDSGLPEWVAGNLITLYGQMRQGVLAQTYDTVRTITGHDPVSFARWAHDHAPAFKG